MDNRESKQPAQVSKPGQELKTYTVKGPGSVTRGGEIHAAGTELQLSEAEAKSLGDALVFGKVKPIDVISKRAGGKYVVSEDRSLWHDGKMRTAGFQIELSEKEARILGDAVEVA